MTLNTESRTVVGLAPAARLTGFLGAAALRLGAAALRAGAAFFFGAALVAGCNLSTCLVSWSTLLDRVTSDFEMLFS